MADGKERAVHKGQVQVHFPPNPEHLPVYANVALVNTISDDVIIGFGFVDPMLLAELKPEDAPRIEAKTIVRIAMSRTNAKQFLKSLQDAIERTERSHAPDAGE